MTRLSESNGKYGREFWIPIGVSVVLAVVAMVFAVWRDNIALVQSAYIGEVQRFVELESDFTLNVYDFTDSLLTDGKPSVDSRNQIQRSLLEQLNAAKVISDRLRESDKSLFLSVESTSLELRRAVEATHTREELRQFYFHLSAYLDAKRNLTIAVRESSGTTG